MEEIEKDTKLEEKFKKELRKRQNWRTKSRKLHYSRVGTTTKCEYERTLKYKYYAITE